MVYPMFLRERGHGRIKKRMVTRLVNNIPFDTNIVVEDEENRMVVTVSKCNYLKLSYELKRDFCVCKRGTEKLYEKHSHVLLMRKDQCN